LRLEAILSGKVVTVSASRTEHGRSNLVILFAILLFKIVRAKSIIKTFYILKEIHKVLHLGEGTVARPRFGRSVKRK
jgi:hypothetical protein